MAPRRVPKRPRGPFKRLKEAVLVIPLTFNDGTAVSNVQIVSIVNELYASFRGWMKEGIVEGAYRMRTGKRRVEKLLKISVVLEEDQIPDLEAMVAKWCTELDQETMLLKITAANVKFIPPSESNDV
jgi:hypothetical protein